MELEIKVLRRNLLLPCPFLIDKHRVASDLMERKGPQKIGQNGKHSYNKIQTRRTPAVQVVKSMTCGLRIREQELTSIHML